MNFFLPYIIVQVRRNVRYLGEEKRKQGKENEVQQNYHDSVQICACCCLDLLASRLHRQRTTLCPSLLSFPFVERFWLAVACFLLVAKEAVVVVA